MTAGGQTFAVTQAAAACTYSISPTSQSATSGGGAFTVTVTATSSCAWTAVSNASWITVTAGASGSGNGSVSLECGGQHGGDESHRHRDDRGADLHRHPGGCHLQLLADAGFGIARPRAADPPASR